MKKTLIILAFFLMVILAWAIPYFKDLRDQGLTAEIAYAYFFGRPDHKINNPIYFIGKW